MQFEDFDKKVREAAEHHHPSYDEKAWDNMEKLLDKHLPVEKNNRRRLLFLLFLFIVAGGGAYLWTAKPWKTASMTETKGQTVAQPPVSSIEKNNEPSGTNSKNNPGKSSLETNAAGEPSTLKNNTAAYPADKHADQETDGSTNSIPFVAGKTDKKENTQYFKKSIAGTAKRMVTPQNSFSKISNKQVHHLKIAGTEPGDNTINKTENTVATNIHPDNNHNNNAAVAPSRDNTTSAEIVPDKSDSAPSKDSVASKEAVKETVTKNDAPAEKKAAPKKSRSSFAITISGGPDVSTVGLNNIGKMNCVIGAGLSYTYNRFTLRSGFYAVKKIYTADPEDYHPPKHSPPTYLNLTKVDGDCKVYEIPVTFSYNFGETKTHSWFGAIGLSSFLMKKETYDYYYKDSNGNPAQKTWSTQNNKHLFSVLNLSAGYEKKLNKNLSLTAEPYFKIPLEGIGYGNIQMNSMGVLISMNIKPFASRK